MEVFGSSTLLLLQPWSAGNILFICESLMYSFSLSREFPLISFMLFFFSSSRSIFCFVYYLLLICHIYFFVVVHCSFSLIFFIHIS